MPSDADQISDDNAPGDVITGRCYCGRSSVSANTRPTTVAYCHCSDCRRVTGAPVAAFAAFDHKHLRIEPEMTPFSANGGVMRWFCTACGSPLAAQFDYLPDQIYVPVGILDQVDQLEPKLHCHSEARLNWLHIEDGLERHTGSAHATLSGS